MAKSGDVLEMPQMGVRVEVRRSAAETGGELVEVDVAGRARGRLVQSHVHRRQTERFEPLSGALRLVMTGTEPRVLRPGDVGEVPPGTPHRQISEGEGTVRVTIRPAGATEAFLERLAELCREGRVTRTGLPRPVAAAELVRDFGADGGAAQPPPAVQRALAAGILGAARAGRALRDRVRGAPGEEVFAEEWAAPPPPDAVFAALADARSYPRWWTPVYLDVDADGPPAL